MWQTSYNNEPTLYLLATPIGNLEDITIRTINILNEVDAVFSEDTRVTSILLNHLNINKRLISLHEHNEDKQKHKVLEYLNSGKSVALVTDRGTPIISDPGFITVKYIIENNYNVVSLPGPCALITALITSGIAPQPFLFYGFLNSKESHKKKELITLKERKETIIFYEAPHRLFKTLETILEIFGNRNFSISREISKKYESIYRGNIKDFLLKNNELKGEFVLVIEGNKDKEKGVNVEEMIELIENYVEEGSSINNAIKQVSENYNYSKNKLYQEYHLRRK